MRRNRRKKVSQYSPRNSNVALDTNAFEPANIKEKENLDRFLTMAELGDFVLIAPHSVMKEIDNPKTPKRIRKLFSDQIATVQVGLTVEELQKRENIRKILKGNSGSNKHDADAEHLAEAAKYAGFFVTHDNRILKYSDRLRDEIGSHFSVVSMDGFLSIYDNSA